MADVSDQVRDDASQIRDATIAAVENLQKLSADNLAGDNNRQQTAAAG